MARTDVAAAVGGSRGLRMARTDVGAAIGGRSGLRLARTDVGAAIGGRSGLRMARTVRWRLGSRGPWWRRRPHARTAGRTRRRRGVWSIRGAAWTAVVVVVVVSAIVFSVVVPSVIASEYASSHAQCQADCKDCHRYSLHIASLQGIVVLWGVVGELLQTCLPYTI